MDKYSSNTYVGIRQKGTDELLAVYPELVQGTKDSVEKKVKDWFYMLSCHTSEIIDEVYVDRLNEKEIKTWENS